MIINQNRNTLYFLSFLIFIIGFFAMPSVWAGHVSSIGIDIDSLSTNVQTNVPKVVRFVLIVVTALGMVFAFIYSNWKLVALPLTCLIFSQVYFYLVYNLDIPSTAI